MAAQLAGIARIAVPILRLQGGVCWRSALQAPRGCNGVIYSASWPRLLASQATVGGGAPPSAAGAQW